MRKGGVFEIVKHAQHRCAKVEYSNVSGGTGSRAVTEPDTNYYQTSKDLIPKTEEIVNTALLMFLNALTADFTQYHAWSPERKLFKAQFGKNNYQSCVDGFLEDEGLGSVRAIVETKKKRRDPPE
ncbi:hypothetical protein B7463_g2046, partial [Scytalidium lignicola]